MTHCTYFHRERTGRSFIALILAALFLVLGSAAPSNAQPKELIMGIASADSKELLSKSWQPVLDDMSRALGIPVRAALFDDYAGVIWHLATGKAQLAWMGNKAAIEAIDRAKSEVLVQSLTVHGPGYYSHLIVRDDSPYNDAAGVMNNASSIIFGNGDPNSTSGFVVPGYYLFASKGINPKKIFKRIRQNNHEGNFHAVVKGDVDVATSNSIALGRYKKSYPDEHARIRTVWTSPLIPSDPIVVRTDLDPAIKKAIQDFLLAYGKTEEGKSEEKAALERAHLLSRKWTGFVPSDNSQLDPIRKLELFKKRLAIQKTPQLSDAVKARKVEEIDRQLSQLNN